MDIISRLEEWAPLIASGYEVPAASIVMHEAIAALRGMEAENVRLRAALENIISDAAVPRQQYERNGPQWTSPRGRELYDADYLHEKMDELAEIAKEALNRGKDHP